MIKDSDTDLNWIAQKFVNLEVLILVSCGTESLIGSQYERGLALKPVGLVIRLSFWLLGVHAIEIYRSFTAHEV